MPLRSFAFYQTCSSTSTTIQIPLQIQKLTIKIIEMSDLIIAYINIKLKLEVQETGKNITVLNFVVVK